MGSLQRGCHHDAGWRAAETSVLTSALRAELLSRPPLPPALSAQRFRGDRRRGEGWTGTATCPEPSGPRGLAAATSACLLGRGPAHKHGLCPRREDPSGVGRDFQKDPEFVCRGGVRNVRLPPTARLSAAEGAGPGAGGLWRARRRGSRKGAPTGPGAHSLVCPHFRPVRLLGSRRTGGHEDPPARDRAPGRTAHALQSGPADAVVPGGSQRAAVISNCALATERRGRRGGAASRWLHRCTPGRGAAGQMSLRLV